MILIDFFDKFFKKYVIEPIKNYVQFNVLIIKRKYICSRRFDAENNNLIPDGRNQNRLSLGQIQERFGFTYSSTDNRSKFLLLIN